VLFLIACHDSLAEVWLSSYGKAIANENNGMNKVPVRYQGFMPSK
jgi:hypothetical protein